MFYDQLGLAQSLAPKKKLRFKNKLLSLDVSVIDLFLSMYGLSYAGSPSLRLTPAGERDEGGPSTV